MFVHRLKLRPPQASAVWVERPAVERRLESGQRVLAIVAGPGYGKSVAAARVHEQWRGPRFWYALDEADADLSVFAAHLAEMLRTVERPLDIVGEAWRLGSPKEIGAQFAEVLADVAPAPLLVFDDVHCLEGSRALQALDELVLRGARAGANFVLCGRSMPVALHALAASAQLASVGVADLKLSESESVAYLSLSAAADTSAQTLARLAQRVEGWPAGLALVASTAAIGWSPEGAESFTARDEETRRMLFEYLASEVLGALAEGERDFLLRTSILDELEVELCDAVMAWQGSSEMLASLARRGLFVTRRSQDAFSCHQLFREFLRHTLLRTESAESIATLHVRAAEASAQRGDPAGQVRHLIDAGDLDRATPALEVAALGLLANGQIARVAGFLERLGADRVEASPTLLIARGRVQHQRGDWDRALGSFERAMAMSRECGAVDLLAEALRLSSPILASRGDFPRLHDLLQQTLVLPGISESTQTALSATLGAVHLDSERYDEALAAFRDVMPAIVARGDAALQGLVLHNTAVAHVRRGEPYTALAMYERALKLKRSAGQRVSALLTTANLIYVHRVLGDLDEAERLTARLLEDAADVGNATILSHALENEAGIKLARGDAAGAVMSYQEALRTCDPGDVFVMPEILHGIARCDIALGKLAEADDLCVKSLAAFRLARRRQELAPVYLTRAEAAVAAGDGAGALGFIGNALEARLQGEDATIRASVGLEAAALLLRLGARGIPDVEKTAHEAAADGVALLHQRDYRFLLRTKAATFAELREPMRRWGVGSSLVPAADEGSSLRVELLGGLRVFVNSEPVRADAWKRRRARDIFAYLVSLGGRPVPRARLVDLYWPETDADAAHDNLRVTVSAIRRAVGDVVKFEANGYRFAAPPRTVVDVATFDEHIDAARQALVRGAANEALARYVAAASLYRGEFLDGMDDGNWQWRERDRLRAAYLEALRAIAGSLDTAASERRYALDRILEAAPFDLDAVGMRLAALLAESRVGEARREHDEWRSRYRATVGAEAPNVWPDGAIARH